MHTQPSHNRSLGKIALNCAVTERKGWRVSNQLFPPIATADSTRNSAVDDKPRDAFVQMQWRGWRKKPSPYVLSR